MLLLLHVVLTQRGGWSGACRGAHAILCLLQQRMSGMRCVSQAVLPFLAPSLPHRSSVCCRREKDAEVSSLKQAVAERDVKLKSAKGELLEARLSLQQKDTELKVGAGWAAAVCVWRWWSVMVVRGWGAGCFGSCLYQAALVGADGEPAAAAAAAVRAS